MHPTQPSEREWVLWYVVFFQTVLLNTQQVISPGECASWPLRFSGTLKTDLPNQTVSPCGSVISMLLSRNLVLRLIDRKGEALWINFSFTFFLGNAAEPLVHVVLLHWHNELCDSSCRRHYCTWAVTTTCQHSKGVKCQGSRQLVNPCKAKHFHSSLPSASVRLYSERMLGDKFRPPAPSPSAVAQSRLVSMGTCTRLLPVKENGERCVHLGWGVQYDSRFLKNT